MKIQNSNDIFFRAADFGPVQILNRLGDIVTSLPRPPLWADFVSRETRFYSGTPPVITHFLHAGRGHFYGNRQNRRSPATQPTSPRFYSQQLEQPLALPPRKSSLWSGVVAILPCCPPLLSDGWVASFQATSGNGYGDRRAAPKYQLLGHPVQDHANRLAALTRASVTSPRPPSLYEYWIEGEGVLPEGL